MLQSLLRETLFKVVSPKTQSLMLTGAGMASLLVGGKVSALGLFGAGFKGLEAEWRKAHPDFNGGLAERWDASIRFYEATHQDKTNRTLHIVGIPMIVGGAAGLLLWAPFRPLWFISAASFTTGWVLNFVGHGIYEKKAPAFADDPLSFLAGPVWDFQQLFGGSRATPAASAEVTVH